MQLRDRLNSKEYAQFKAAQRHVANGEFYLAVADSSDVATMEFINAGKLLEALRGSYGDEAELLVLVRRTAIYLDDFRRP